jgi:hypothetical protein
MVYAFYARSPPPAQNCAENGASLPPSRRGAVTVTFWTVGGLVLGAVILAGGIGRRLPGEEG